MVVYVIICIAQSAIVACDSCTAIRASSPVEKCLNLGYFTQRLRPSVRCIIMESKYRTKITLLGGDVFKKPPRIKSVKFNALKNRCLNYESKFEPAVIKELLEWYPDKCDEILRLV